MIDEKKLVVEKLKDTAVDYLADEMGADLGDFVSKYRQELDKKFIDSIQQANKYYSASEIKQAYRKMCRKHSGIFNAVTKDGYKKVKELNEDLNLRRPYDDSIQSSTLKTLLQKLKQNQALKPNSP